MNENNINPDLIIEDLKKLPKTAKIVLVFGCISLAALAVGGIMLLAGSEDIWGPTLLIMGIGFSVLFWGIFLAKKIKSASKLKNMNLDLIRNELLYGANSYSNVKTYFTQTYMLSNYYYAFAVKYSDIAWVYRFDKKSQYGALLASDLMIMLKNGKKEITTWSDVFVQEIFSRNPNIIVGYSWDNRKKYKEICKAYKNNSVYVQPSNPVQQPNYYQAPQQQNQTYNSNPVPPQNNMYNGVDQNNNQNNKFI